MSRSVTAPSAPTAGPGSLPKMLGDLSSLAFGQLLSVALGFAGFAYLARTLTPESYGLVEYAVGLVGLAAIVIEGGMGSLGTLHVSRDPSRAPELAGRVPVARLLLAAIVVPLVGLSSLLSGFDATMTTLTWLFALSLFAVPFRQDWLLQGLDRMTFVAPAQGLKSGAFALGVVLLVHGGQDLIRIGLIEAVAALLVAGYFLVVQRIVAIPVSLDLRISQAWELIRAGASIGASNILWPFMVYAPILLVTNMAGGAEAAWLGGAQRIVVALVSFSALYFFNLYPLIGRGLREDPASWRRLMGSSFRLIAWSSIGVALATSLFAGAIVTTVFGEPFRMAGPVLAIYIWVLPLRLLSGHARWTLLAAERQGVLLLVECACAATIVLLCVALIPSYGAAGAAWSGVLGNIVGWVAAHRAAERFAGSLPGARQMLLPVGGAILGAAVARLVGGPVALNVLAGVVVYTLYARLTAADLFADAVRLAHAKRVTPPESGGSAGS